MPHKPGPHRNNGRGMVQMESCASCGFRIPKDFDVANGYAVPCSEGHIRCVRCGWPIAKGHELPGGLCVACSPEKIRRMYYRKTEDGWTGRANVKPRRETQDE